MFTKRETNFCKGIAIILMLFHHLFNDFEEYEGYVVNYAPFTAERIQMFALTAKICVAIFVFVSGYGIAATYRKKFGSEKAPSSGELLRFAWDRYWKLMTGYWFAFLLTLLCQPFGRTIFDAYGHGIRNILLFLLIDLSGLSTLFGTPTLNASWWYMSIAFSIIILMPFVMRLMHSFGAFLTTAACIVLLWLLQGSNSYSFYLFSMLLGAFCFETRLFERVAGLGGGKRPALPIRVICEAAVLAGLLLYRANYNYYGMIDGLIALALALLAGTILTGIPVVSAAMEFLGKHSANMFLVHNQIYSYYFLGFFYSFRHWALILLVLVAVSLAVSVVMEFLKRRTGYNSVMARLGAWLPAHIFS